MVVCNVMHTPHTVVAFRRVSRRTVLKSAGVTLALPLLECMTSSHSRADAIQPLRRMLLISNNLGVLPKLFFPKNTGRDYTLSPYLLSLENFRADFTVFSGLSHPGVVGGHSTENCFLTAARGPTKSGFRNQISLDQFASEKLGWLTRFPTLNLGVNIDKAHRSLSWTRDGVLLPAEENAPALFQKMFVQGDPASVHQQLQRLEERGSILDTLLDDTNQFRRTLGRDDKARLDQYLTSVREVEERLHAAREWELRPKPSAPQPPPVDIHDKKLFIEKFDLMLAMAQLALESRSTRIVTLMVDAFATPAFQLHPNHITTDGYHNLSHHGQSVEKIQQLEDVDRQQMALLAKLLKTLSDTPDAGQRSLDNTIIVYGSNMGDSNTHDNSNLPILLAGGGFRHGNHLASNHSFDTPLCNLFLSILHRLGIDVDAFGSSTGTLTGLEQT